jgi:hypothetical protein
VIEVCFYLYCLISDPSDKTETSETPVETEKETEPEEQAEETAVPVARRGRSPKSGSEVALFAKKTKGKKLRSSKFYIFFFHFAITCKMVDEKLINERKQNK